MHCCPKQYACDEPYDQERREHDEDRDDLRHSEQRHGYESGQHGEA